MSNMQRCFDFLHLALFSGKGGVGKTTLSCGFARRWAQQFPNEQILLLSTDPAHSLGDVLQVLVSDQAEALPDLPNLQVRSLDAEQLLQEFKDRYGRVLETLVERGSFVQGEDLTPVWDLNWPGLDELMGILEIQRLLRDRAAARIVVDMAPSGHTLNLFGLMDFLDNLLDSLTLFQEKHQVMLRTFSGRYVPDQVDAFLDEMKSDLQEGRQLLQDATHTACLVVAIAEPMSWLETERFTQSLVELKIPVGGLFINHVVGDTLNADRLYEQQELLQKFATLAQDKPIFTIPQQSQEPVGSAALDQVIAQVQLLSETSPLPTPPAIHWPEKVPPGFDDFITAGRRLILVGGKGGVGKTTIAATLAWGMAQHHSDRAIRVISIDPAHSLGDAFGVQLSHQPSPISANAALLTGQEIDAEQVLDEFREEYLWELAEMMSGDRGEGAIEIAYGPQAWRQIVSQALPGIDEMLSLVAVTDLLERKEQDLIILDTAPTGHLLRFLEMPTALSDWLAWIFKLWIKYQDVLGRTEFMGRLRNLRQRVVQAQKKLQDPNHTEFIGVVQAESAVLAEAERLARSLTDRHITQRYLVHNRYEPGEEIDGQAFPNQTIVRLPLLPRSISPLERIQGAAQLLF